MATGVKLVKERDALEFSSESKADRRIYFRERVLLSDLQLEDGSRGIVLDISESGLAMQSARSLNPDSNPRLRFQLSQSTKWIEVDGKFAWVSPSRCAAGVEFGDLSLDALIAIKTWMFEIASLTATEDLESDLSDSVDPQVPTAGDGPHSKGSETTPVTQPAQYEILELAVPGVIHEAVTRKAEVNTEWPPISGDPTAVQIGPGLGLSELRSLMKPPSESGARWPVNSAMVLWSVILVAFLIFGLHRRIESSERREQVAGGQRAESSYAENLGAANPGIGNRSEPPEDPGFVLQVAAMQSESSALAAADVFRAKNLSVFVMKPATGNLYLVLIGPYGDAASAAAARAEIKRQGFDAIQKRTSSLQ